MRLASAALVFALGLAVAWPVLGDDHNDAADVAPAEPSALDRDISRLLETIPRVTTLEGRVRRRWRDGRADRLQIESPRWRNKLPRRCRTVGGYRAHCSGPRNVPEAHGLAAELATHLGLHLPGASTQLLHGPPLREWIDAARGIDRRGRLTFPVPSGRAGRGFGRTRRGALRNRPHLGLDIGGQIGARVVAARGGLVAYSDTSLVGYGNAIVIVHEDGSTTFYAHNDRNYVFTGQRVQRGQHIADLGESGFANGPHVHFEYRVRGTAKNPIRHFLRRRGRRR